MPKDKITVEDISFLINRLTTALEQFNEQIQQADLSDPPPKVRKETAEDLKIRQFYISVANISNNLPQKERDKFTNPTPSEFSELKRQYRKRRKESDLEQANKIARTLSPGYKVF